MPVQLTDLIKLWGATPTACKSLCEESKRHYAVCVKSTHTAQCATPFDKDLQDMPIAPAEWRGWMKNSVEVQL